MYGRYVYIPVLHPSFFRSFVPSFCQFVVLLYPSSSLDDPFGLLTKNLENVAVFELKGGCGNDADESRDESPPAGLRLNGVQDPRIQARPWCYWCKNLINSITLLVLAHVLPCWVIPHWIFCRSLWSGGRRRLNCNVHATILLSDRIKIKIRKHSLKRKQFLANDGLGLRGNRGVCIRYQTVTILFHKIAKGEALLKFDHAQLSTLDRLPVAENPSLGRIFNKKWLPTRYPGKITESEHWPTDFVQCFVLSATGAGVC
jgi:hypothetical protein